MMTSQIQFIVDENDKRIDSWLTLKIENISRTYIQKLIEDGHILVNGSPVKTKHKLKIEDVIDVNIPEPTSLEVLSEKIPLNILYEDADLIVINKEKGMVVHPAAGHFSGTLVNALMEHCGKELSDINGVIRPGIVHRIDKDTSGVIVVAKNNIAHEKLSELFKTHDITRVYLALVKGIIREDAGKIDAPIGRHPVERKEMSVNLRNGRRAVTYFKVLERFPKASLIEVTLETGRTHQIRVHMKYIDHSVLGDKVYGGKKDPYHCDGQALHAKVLGFIHPIKNEYMEFQAEPPKYFQTLLNTLRGLPEQK